MKQNKFPTGLMIAAFLMMAFGLAEVVTSFRHNFFGLTTLQTTLSAAIGATIGCFYFVSGCLVLTKRRKAAIAAIILLIADALGRVLMVATGLYPVTGAYQTFGIVTGTTIVILFTCYIGIKLKAFR